MTDTARKRSARDAGVRAVQADEGGSQSGSRDPFADLGGPADSSWAKPDGAITDPELTVRRTETLQLRKLTPRSLITGDEVTFQWRLLGLLLILGALVGAITLALPHPAAYADAQIVGAVVGAFVAGVLVYGIAARLPGALVPLAVLGGTLAVTFASYAADGAGGYGLFYVWIAVYSFYFLPLRTALLELTGIAVAYGGILYALPLESDSELARLIVMMSTLAVVGALVHTLVARGRRISEDLGTLATQRAELARRLERMARTDELTGLPNRRGWEEGLAREIARARRTKEPLCVALLDIDHFKRFNDHHGHLAGDELLRSLAPAWRAHLRDSDFLIRFGGEEFAVALPACDAGDAELLLERLRGAMPLEQTCSAGVAQWNGAETPRELVDRADRALYDAKHNGRDRIAHAA